MTKTYNLIFNEYCGAKAVASEVNDFFKNNGFTMTADSPDFCVVIGGDGTFLRSIHATWASIQKTIFIPIAGGVVNFYATFTATTLSLLFKYLQGYLRGEAFPVKTYDLLEASFNRGTKAYAINEIKVVDNVKTMLTRIAINHETLEFFQGSGLVFATASGATGYMRSVGGAIMLSSKHLWEMKEIAPVANAKFSTINSALILDESQRVELQGGLIGRQIVLDTHYIGLTADELQIKISDIRCQVLYNPDEDQSLTCRLKTIFSLNGSNAT